MSVFDEKITRLGSNKKLNQMLGEVAFMTHSLSNPDKEFPGMPSKEEALIAEGLGLKSAYELPRYVTWNTPPPPPPPTTLLSKASRGESVTIQPGKK